MKEFSMRQLNEEDAEIFRPVRLEALQLHPEAFSASFDQTKRKSLEFFKQLLHHNKVLGAFDIDGCLQGVVGISFNESPKMSHIANVFGMYVRPDVRGSGVARKLMQEALNSVDLATMVKLSVNAQNKPAYQLYHSLGFIEWARDEGALCVDDVLYDEILMKIKLK